MNKSVMAVIRVLPGSEDAENPPVKHERNNYRTYAPIGQCILIIIVTPILKLLECNIRQTHSKLRPQNHTNQIKKHHENHPHAPNIKCEFSSNTLSKPTSSDKANHEKDAEGELYAPVNNITAGIFSVCLLFRIHYDCEHNS